MLNVDAYIRESSVAVWPGNNELSFRLLPQFDRFRFKKVIVEFARIVKGTLRFKYQGYFSFAMIKLERAKRCGAARDLFILPLSSIRHAHNLISLF